MPEGHGHGQGRLGSWLRLPLGVALVLLLLGLWGLAGREAAPPRPAGLPAPATGDMAAAGRPDTPRRPEPSAAPGPLPALPDEERGPAGRHRYEQGYGQHGYGYGYGIGWVGLRDGGPGRSDAGSAR